MNAIARKTIAHIIVATAILYSPTLYAADLTAYPAGSIHTNVFTIDEKQIPLPKGSWELKFSSAFPETGNNHAARSKLATVLLLQRSGAKYSAAIIIRTNDVQSDGRGWPRSRVICDRKNVHFSLSDRDYNPEASDCWQVNHIVNTFTASRNPTYNQMKRWARTNAGTTTFLSLQYVINDSYDVLRVDYLVNPTAFGFPSLDEREWKYSQWHAGSLDNDPAGKTAVQTLKKIGQKLHPLVRRGFRNDLQDFKADFYLALRR